MLVDHLTSEYGVTTSGRGRTVVEWKLKPGRPDNHLLDCVVGCHVVASMLGVKLETGGAPTKPVQKRVRRRVNYL